MAVSVKVKPGRSLGSSRGDITIYDFANSSKRNARARKSYSRVAVEKGDDEEAMEDETVATATVRVLPPPEEELVPYADYHIDIWHSIAEHIRPEDVARFALICRKTAEVTQSAKFWHALYRRFYDGELEEQMPRRLQLENMWRLRGLRACTIRALFYMYRPFIHRIAAAPFNDPHRVAGRRLLFCWCTKGKSGWRYYFKLRARFGAGSRVARSARMQQAREESLEYMQDTYANAEEGCQILIVVTDTAHLLPQYGAEQQLYVKSLTQTLASGMSMTKYKVRLQIANYCGRVVDELVFVPVRQTRVLDWWNPEYYREDPTIDGGEGKEEEEGVEDGDESAGFWDV
uniref:Transmembrane protein 183 n=1 Tax=Culex pipiens TaxID=7175 RepID=A0A8D8HSA6_CULPI